MLANDQKWANQRNNLGETLLHQAAIEGDVEEVKSLIGRNASVNTKDNAGWSPLHEACANGYVAIVQLLIDNSAVINKVDNCNKDTPLHDAAISSHVEVVNILVKANADLNATNKKGLTPLSVATDPKVIKLLDTADHGDDDVADLAAEDGTTPGPAGEIVFHDRENEYDSPTGTQVLDPVTKVWRPVSVYTHKANKNVVLRYGLEEFEGLGKCYRWGGEDTLLDDDSNVVEMRPLPDTSAAPHKILEDIDFIEALVNIVVKVRKIDKEGWFATPVNPNEFHDYPGIIKIPIDTGIILAKAKEHAYRSRHEFIDAFRQMAHNAIIFNGPEHEVYKAAAKIRDAVVALANQHSAALDRAEKALGTFREAPKPPAITESERDLEAYRRGVPEKLRNVSAVALCAAYASMLHVCP